MVGGVLVEGGRLAHEQETFWVKKKNQKQNENKTNPTFLKRTRTTASKCLAAFALAAGASDNQVFISSLATHLH